MGKIKKLKQQNYQKLRNILYEKNSNHIEYFFLFAIINMVEDMIDGVEKIIIYMCENIQIFMKFINFLLLVVYIYYTNLKLINKKISWNIGKTTLIIVFTIIYQIIKNRANTLISTISLIILISIAFSTNNFGKSILTTIISVSINYAFDIISIIVSFIFYKILNIYNDVFLFFIINLFHCTLIYTFFKMKKLKNGITFLKMETFNENTNIFLLNICSIVLFYTTIIFNANVNSEARKQMLLGISLITVIMAITIYKCLQAYYKQKLLDQELNKYKEEIENKNKEIAYLEAENIKISKKSHTLVHKQKSLEHKIDEMLMNTEISTEQAIEVKERLKAIEEELYQDKTSTELSKTEIPEIDDMLKYMQSECIKNKINFELQLKGNIHHMKNNLIDKKDLETLLADHIRNAIIAINHTDNVNRSILVKLGKIEENYSLYIYDTGVEFEKETLENLGKKPSTTHKDEGGTGMGFMNTFDTLRKCNASLIIDEIGKPSKDNYTKAIIIKFDGKSEFKIKSYKEEQVETMCN